MSKTLNNSQLAQLMIRIFDHHWDKAFIFDPARETPVSYRGFWAAVKACEATLTELGIKRGDCLGLLLPNCFELIVVYFTALIMRLRIIPIDPGKGREEVAEILSQIEIDHLICDKHVPSSCKKIILLEDLKIIFQQKEGGSVTELEIFNEIDYQDLFLITFTSGSTATPKGVKHSFANLAKSALAFKNRFNFGPEHIFYHNLPMTYMAGILNLIFLPFLSESKIVLGPRFSVINIMSFWQLPTEYSVNVFWFIPTVISLLAKMDRGEEGKDFFRRIKAICCVGTAPLGPQLKIAFEEKYQTTLYESYGLSETLFVASNYPGQPQQPGGVGPLLDGMFVDFDKDGEILIGAPWMFLGYANVKTDEYFDQSLYRSGDVGTLNSKGSLKITGRKKDLIIRGGINITPLKAEHLIESLNIFEEFTVLGMEDAILGEKSCCFFVSKGGPPLLAAKKRINSLIADKLGRDYIIDEFVEIATLPRNSNHKIDKLKIRADYLAGANK